MAIYKCKMCGGTLEVQPGESTAICDSCGSRQTLPKLDDERRVNMFERANYFRRNGDFDKAEGIFESIVAEDNTDAEAYWSLVLCKYGINYVEDPRSHKQMPTVNRAQYTSVQTDDNYLFAIKYADGYQREIYESEAKQIDSIQKGILAISQKEEPFDIFICYKDTDNSGERTKDSVIAQDIYNALTKEGYKVFFSRITLEGKLGTEYEPYIFAALNSAKVMLVVGTSKENLESVWVKNEWSRYLAIIKNDHNKVLIPVYADMNPYDMPDELSNLMAQDVSKIGFMQDLLHGIEKICRETKETSKLSALNNVAVSTNNSQVAPLLKRVNLFLEDENWESADEYCERILDTDPENAMAYVGKLMVELGISKIEYLNDLEGPFDDNNNYLKAIRFGDETLVSELEGYISHIKERNENNRINGIYLDAKREMDSAASESAFKSAASIFSTIRGVKDADELYERCLENAEGCRKDAIYYFAKSKMAQGKIADYEAAIGLFNSVSEWKDSNEQICACERRIEQIKEKEEADRIEAERRDKEKRIEAEKAREKRIKIVKIAAPVATVIITLIVVLTKVIIPSVNYNEAVKLLNDGDIISAYESFVALDGYKDSSEKASSIHNQYLLKTAKIGDIVIFGTYEQDNNISNGKEDIEWVVLEKEGYRVFVISNKSLDCKKYNDEFEYVAWETCTLRKWLNSDFLNTAFSLEEQTKILSTTVSADQNPEYNTDSGNATIDKVFLLSINEANQYFTTDEARKCVLTDYTVSQGAYTLTNGGMTTCWWWLRSPGIRQDYATSVRSGGRVDCYGYSVSDDDGCVRPALWINLES